MPQVNKQDVSLLAEVCKRDPDSAENVRETCTKLLRFGISGIGESVIDLGVVLTQARVKARDGSWDDVATISLASLGVTPVPGRLGLPALSALDTSQMVILKNELTTSCRNGCGILL